MITNTLRLITPILALALLALPGCKDEKAASKAGATAKASKTAKAGATAKAGVPAKAKAKASAKIAKVVFVDKAKACDCTKKRVEGSWAALQKALGTPAKLPVERLHIDTDGPKVAPYRKQKPVMALPGIYFVDGKGKVLAMLQGAISAPQVTSTLAGGTRAP